MPIDERLSDDIRVLIVDDDPDFVALTVEVLRKRSDRFEVVSETNPTDGLDRLDEAFDCVVTDYEMPEMDGIEFLQTVRQTHPNLPVILFTGKGSERIASEAISAGVTDYLQKKGGLDQYEILTQQITNAAEKYRAERRVERSIEAIETTTAGIGFLDDAGEFIYVNEAYSEIFGYERDELIGTHWERLYRTEGIDTVRETILPQAKEGVWTGQSVIVDKDGETIVTDQAVTYAEDGTLIWTVTDVTDHQATAEELTLKDQVIDAAPIGVTIADATQPDNPIIYANERFEELTGYPNEQIVGENCRFLQGEGTADEPVAALRDTIENGESVTVELRNYRKDGTEFWNRVSIAPIRDADGTITHYVGFQADITERKQIECEADRLLERFEEFGSVLAHDLQKPLSTARGRIELVRQTEDWDELDNIDDTLSRLNTSINEFADAMREGQIAGDPTVVELQSVSESTWRSIMPGSATLEIIDNPRIRADKQALGRLLENLFRNAFEHSDSDVTVRIGALADGFYVADDGPGIPEELRTEVFSPGFTTRDHGTGMGLTSVRQIVLAHRWEINITESDAGGTRFEIHTQTNQNQSNQELRGVSV